MICDKKLVELVNTMPNKNAFDELKKTLIQDQLEKITKLTANLNYLNTIEFKDISGDNVEKN